MELIETPDVIMSLVYFVVSIGLFVATALIGNGYLLKRRDQSVGWLWFVYFVLNLMVIAIGSFAMVFALIMALKYPMDNVSESAAVLAGILWGLILLLCVQVLNRITGETNRQSENENED